MWSIPFVPRETETKIIGEELIRNEISSAYLREQATIAKTIIVKRRPKKESRIPALFLILTLGSKKLAERRVVILSQHCCSMRLSRHVSSDAAINLRILNETLMVRLSMDRDRVG